MKKTKYLALVLAAVALAAMLSLAACGGQQQSEEAAVEEQATEAVQSAVDEATAGTTADAQSVAGTEAEQYVGTWEFTSMTDAEGNPIDLEEYAKAQGVDPSAMKFSYELAVDGTAAGIVAGVSSPATWTATGDVITITAGGQSVDYQVATMQDGSVAMSVVDPNTGNISYLVKTA